MVPGASLGSVSSGEGTTGKEKGCGPYLSVLRAPALLRSGGVIFLRGSTRAGPMDDALLLGATW